MTDTRKFTPPTEFPAVYVNGIGIKIIILGRSLNYRYPFIGYDESGRAQSFTADGRELWSIRETRLNDLHDLPERIVRWKNIYSGEDAGGYTSRELCDDGAFSSRTCVHRIECDEDGSNPEIFVEEV